jgi:hypothetical protein
MFMTTTIRTVSRREASEITGVAMDTLRKWAQSDPPRGPAFQKIGHSSQSRTLYSTREIAKWQSDPANYRWPSQRGRRKDDPR